MLFAINSKLYKIAPNNFWLMRRYCKFIWVRYCKVWFIFHNKLRTYNNAH